MISLLLELDKMPNCPIIVVTEGGIVASKIVLPIGGI